MWREGEEVLDILASWEVTLLYLSTIFMYFKENTRSYYYNLQFQERNYGQTGFSRVESFLFIQFSQSFNLLSQAFRSLILFSWSYFLAFNLDSSPSLSSSLRSLNFLASFSNTLMMFSLFLMCSLTTLMGSVVFSCVVMEIREYFCCYSSLSNLDSKFLSVRRTFLFYYWRSRLVNLLQLSSCLIQLTWSQSSRFSNVRIDIGYNYYKIIGF